jgi:hypothetical protein
MLTLEFTTALDELTILCFSIFATLINSAKTTKEVPETGIPLLAPAGEVKSLSISSLTAVPQGHS